MTEEKELTCTIGSIGGETLWIGPVTVSGCGGLVSIGREQSKNPNVPNEIHVTPDSGVMVVKWDDMEVKVTCDSLDNFSVDCGFFAALAYRTFGGKKEFKEKWWKIIQRRIKYH
jgi:hypothetical protein